MSSRQSFSLCYPKHPYVISTERSEWRDLMRSLDYARDDMERSLDFARDDKGQKGTRDDKGQKGARDDKKGYKIMLTRGLTPCEMFC